MNDSDQDPDLLTQALRADLPTERDEARVRARLVAAGVLAGASVVAPSTAAAATSGGLLSKLGSTPLAIKLGASAVVAGAAALPVYHGVASSDEAVAPAAVLAAAGTTPRGASRQEVAGGREASTPAGPELPPRAATVAPQAAPAATPRARGTVSARLEAAQVRAPSTAVAGTGASRTASSPAVGAFPVAEAPVAAAPVDEGTLRAETALMERALTALGRGDFTTADRELAAHSARFPNGHLRLERERALDRLRGKETGR